jgi:hypothetical protein
MGNWLNTNIEEVAWRGGVGGGGGGGFDKGMWPFCCFVWWEISEIFEVWECVYLELNTRRKFAFWNMFFSYVL